MREYTTQAKEAGRKARAKRDSHGPHSSKNRTLSLEIQPFEKLQTLCADKKWKVSRVVDELIESFLTEIEKEGRSKK